MVVSTGWFCFLERRVGAGVATGGMYQVHRIFFSVDCGTYWIFVSTFLKVVNYEYLENIRIVVDSRNDLYKDKSTATYSSVGRTKYKL
jgi:hypothetical protein